MLCRVQQEMAPNMHNFPHKFYGISQLMSIAFMGIDNMGIFNGTFSHSEIVQSEMGKSSYTKCAQVYKPGRLISEL